MKILLFAIKFFLFNFVLANSGPSGLSSAQCRQEATLMVEAYNQRFTQECGHFFHKTQGQQGEFHFSSCPLLRHAKPLLEETINQISDECNLRAKTHEVGEKSRQSYEKVLQAEAGLRMQKKYEKSLSEVHRKFSDFEELQALRQKARNEAFNASMLSKSMAGLPQREETCLGHDLLTSLGQETVTCIDETRGHGTIPYAECEKAKRLSQKLATTLESFDKTKTSAIYRGISESAKGLKDLQETNNRCSKSLGRIRECTTLYHRAFENVGEARMASHCTPKGVLADINYFDKEMNQGGHMEEFLALAEDHDRNRQAEAQHAATLGKLSLWLVEREKAMGQRQTASTNDPSFQVSGQGVQAVQVDLVQSRRCDAFFRPAGCVEGLSQSDVNLKESLAQSVGMILPTTESKLPQIPQVVVGVKPTGQPLVQKSGTTGPVRTQPDSIARSPDRGGSSEGGGRGAGGLFFPPINGNQNSQNGFSPQSFPGGVRKVGGLIYADRPGDPPPMASFKTPGSSTPSSLGLKGTGREQNQKARARRRAKARARNNPHRFGQLEGGVRAPRGTSQARAQSAPKSQPLGSRLSGLAKAMGKKFMSLAGLGSKGGRGSYGGLRNSASNWKQGRKGNRHSRGNIALDPNALKDRYGRYMRGVASERPVLGQKTDDLFQTVCHGYRRRARAEWGIRFHPKSPCPQIH